ncbi:unnamed protein product [Rotaria sp. Silwood1]|nr:unnamed protein product [Rotaria sp. Silwood1]CAF1434111.1 unnamed protein product [Rotaria sp. Silwood1]
MTTSSSSTTSASTTTTTTTSTSTTTTMTTTSTITTTTSTATTTTTTTATTTSISTSTTTTTTATTATTTTSSSTSTTTTTETTMTTTTMSTSTSTSASTTTSTTTTTEKDACSHYLWNQTGVVVAGTGIKGPASNQFDTSECLVIDANKTLYVCDHHNNRIQKWLSSATNGSTVAGASAATGASAIGDPEYLAMDKDGYLYVTGHVYDTVLRISPISFVATVVAGTTSSGTGNNQLDTPTDMVLDDNLNLYVVDSNNKRVMKWIPNSTTGIVVIKLIEYQTKICIYLHSIPSRKFLTFCFQLNQLITTRQNYPLSIIAHDQYKLDVMLEDDLFKATFSKLKSLTLSNIETETIYSIIFVKTAELYQRLERLNLLVKIKGEFGKYDDIERLCSSLISSKMKLLKYFMLNFERSWSVCECNLYMRSNYLDLEFTELVEGEKSFSHLETIIIGSMSDDCYLSETTICFHILIEHLLPCLPKLKNLIIDSIHFETFYDRQKYQVCEKHS